MSKRVYFLVPNPILCQSLCGILKEHGVRETKMHIIASQLTPLEELREASLLQTSELARGVEGGLAVGGAAGLLGGLLAVTFPPAGLVLGGGALLTTTLAGAGFGALVSSLVAKDIPNHHLDRFSRYIDDGWLLAIIDVPRKRLDSVVNRVNADFPSVEMGDA